MRGPVDRPAGRQRGVVEFHRSRLGWEAMSERELLERLGLWRIPKWFYDHNWWPARGLKAHDEEVDKMGQNGKAP